VVLATKMDNGKWKLKLKLKLQRRGADVGGRERERERASDAPMPHRKNQLSFTFRSSQKSDFQHKALHTCQLSAPKSK
jgi:hypothetical protein